MPIGVEFNGRTWYRLQVPPSELRLNITLQNGQCFQWIRVNPAGSSKSANNTKGSKRKRAKQEEEEENSVQQADNSITSPNNPAPTVKLEPQLPASAPMSDESDVKVKMEPLESEISASVAEAVSSTIAAASSLLSPPTPVAAPPSKSDPYYVGVLGECLIGIRETADDILYALYHCKDNRMSIPALDAFLRDYFHLPSTYPDPSTNVPFHCDKSLVHLYPVWMNGSQTDRFKFIATIYPGVRVLRQDPLECLFSFICSSNNNIARITSMLLALRTNYGEKLDVPQSLVTDELHLPASCEFHIFPTLDSLCRIKEEDLRSLGFGYRAKYIVISSQLLREKGGRDYLMGLRQPAYTRDMVQDELVQFTGVGPKVASCIALFSLDRLDEIPCDTHVWKIAVRDYGVQSKKLTGLDLSTVKSVTPKVMKHVGEVFRSIFGAYAGWAHCLLFIAELPEYKKKLQEHAERIVEHHPMSSLPSQSDEDTSIHVKMEVEDAATAPVTTIIDKTKTTTADRTESNEDDSTYDAENNRAKKKPKSTKPQISLAFKQVKPRARK